MEAKIDLKYIESKAIKTAQLYNSAFDIPNFGYV